MTLTLQAVDQLRKEIINGTLTTDENLTERALCDRLQMSRSPVRMAMQILAGEGLLSYSENRGYQLVRTTPDQIEHTYEVRAALEGLACRLMAQNVPSTQTIDELHVELAVGDAVISGYGAGYEDSMWTGMNERFHSCIVNGAGNTALAHALKQATGSPFAGFSSTVILPKDEELDLLKIAQDMHRRVVTAIERGEALRAEALMQEHIFTARDLVIDRLPNAADS
jgi:GntR family transcriptional regulator of vanillate catabolism